MKTSSLPRATSAGYDEMRARILRAAFKAFTENGYAETSTLQIATLAKVSKRDLYAIFANKQAMLVSCIKNSVRKDADARRGAASCHPRSSGINAHDLRQASPDGDIPSRRGRHVSFGDCEAERSPEVARAIDDGRRAARRTVSELVAHAQSLGYLTPDDPSTMADRFLALLREDLMMSLLLGVVTPPGPAKIEARAADATRAFLKIYSASHD